MKIFLDTNVILDWILDRKDAFAQSATYVIDCVIKGDIQAYISSGSVYTFAYILEKNHSAAEAKLILLRLLRIFHIQDIEQKIYLDACSSNFKDIEDLFQYFTANQIERLDYFVTGNIRDFSRYNSRKIELATPLQMANILSKRNSN